MPGEALGRDAGKLIAGDLAAQTEQVLADGVAP